MKAWELCLVIILVCLFAGCADAGKNDMITSNEEKMSIQKDSAVSPEQCFVCGSENESLMPHLTNRDSVGVIHWNSQSVFDTEVRLYDEEGKELFDTEGLSIHHSTFGDGGGSINIQGMPERGISSVSIYASEADEVDLDLLEDVLCQKCLDNVCGFYEDQVNDGCEKNISTTGYCLIDFTEKQIYTLSDPYRGYFIRDYRIKYDIETEEDGGSRIDIDICYLPIRTP